MHVNLVDPGKIYPQEKVVYHGGIGIIECRSSTLVKWFFNDGSLTQDNVKVTNLNNTVIVIRGGKAQNEGTYECHGSWNQEKFIARSTITIRGKSFLWSVSVDVFCHALWFSTRFSVYISPQRALSTNSKTLNLYQNILWYFLFVLGTIIVT